MSTGSHSPEVTLDRSELAQIIMDALDRHGESYHVPKHPSDLAHGVAEAVMDAVGGTACAYRFVGGAYCNAPSDHAIHHRKWDKGEANHAYVFARPARLRLEGITAPAPAVAPVERRSIRSRLLGVRA